MNSQMQIFESDTFGAVRVLEIEGNSWWVLKDVCAALGLNTPHKVAERLDEDERNQIPLIDGVGRHQKTTIINESGLYAVILRSDKPKAKAFRKWVTNIVLPSIRKHGAYIAPDTLDEMLRDTDFAKTVVRQLHAEQEKNEALLDRVEELAPKAIYCDQILRCKNALPVTIIAKDYGMSAVAFNRLLHRLGIQFRVGQTWVLRQQYADLGYTKSSTYHTPLGNGIVHTSWTQLGRIFLYNILLDVGICPMMEECE